MAHAGCICGNWDHAVGGDVELIDDTCLRYLKAIEAGEMARVCWVNRHLMKVKCSEYVRIETERAEV